MTSQTNEREIALSIENAWAEAVVRIWRGDNKFHDQLLADPKSSLEALGAQFEDNVKIEILTQTPGTFKFVIPSKPKDLKEFEIGFTRMAHSGCPCTVCATGGSGLQI